MNPERNVKLETIHCGRVGAGYLRWEGAAPTEGGGTLEGSYGGGFPATSGQRGCLLPRLP